MTEPNRRRSAVAAERKGSDFSQKHPERVAIEPAVRRGLRHAEAAAYVGLSLSMFDKQITLGRLPKPVKFGRASVWDMRRLDDAFEPPGTVSNDNGNPWD